MLMPAGASDSDVLGALVERSSAATKVQAVMRGSSARKKSATSKRESTGEVCWRTDGGLGLVGWDRRCGRRQHGWSQCRVCGRRWWRWMAHWSRPCSQLDARSTYVYPQAVEEVSMPGSNQADADAVFDAAATKVQAVLRGATARKRSVAGVRLSPHSNPNPNPNPSPNPNRNPDPDPNPDPSPNPDRRAVQRSRGGTPCPTAPGRG